MSAIVTTTTASFSDCRLGLSRWRGGRFACTSLIRRWSLEGLTVVRYDDVNMGGDVSSISMSINNVAQLPKTVPRDVSDQG